MNAQTQPGTAVAATSPAQTAALQIEQMQEKFKAALPAHIPAQRFTRTALSALQNPEVLKCVATPGGRQSLYNACLKAAQDGLVLDGREAALVRMNVKVKDDRGEHWEDRLQYMPMVAGIMKKARNSGEITTIVAQPVYDQDEFIIDYVAEGPPVVHRPKIGDRGKVIGVYALARLTDGAWTAPEFMSVAEVEAVRARSKAKSNGPWVTDWSEMARKTVIKRAAKYWPSSTDKETGENVIDLIGRDDGLYEMDEPGPQQEGTPPAKARPARRKGAAQVLTTTATEVHDDQPSDTSAGQQDDEPDDGRFAPIDADFEVQPQDVM